MNGLYELKRRRSPRYRRGGWLDRLLLWIERTAREWRLGRENA